MAEYTSEFEQFWGAYPSRWNKNFQGGSWVKRKKNPAYLSWCKLSTPIRDKCMRIVKKIKSAEGGTVRDCVTWLNQKGWDDIEEEAWKPSIPNMSNIFKSVPGKADVNDARNKQRNLLGRN